MFELRVEETNGVEVEDDDDFHFLIYTYQPILFWVFVIFMYVTKGLGVKWMGG